MIQQLTQACYIIAKSNQSNPSKVNIFRKRVRDGVRPNLDTPHQSPVMRNHVLFKFI